MPSWFNKAEEVKPIVIKKEEVARTPLNLIEPPPIKSREINWFVITPDNADEVWERLRADNVDVVLFGITDNGYEQLALTMAEIRNYIAQNRSIIIKYKEYYEPKKVDPTDK
jgi:hypothetical protein